MIYVRLLRYWYEHQIYYIKWEKLLSDGFHVSNGVRQGGILSPALFNVYVNDLSEALLSSNTGCNINGQCINHILYADDTVIMAPSPHSLQNLLNVCDNYAQDNDIKYNEKKTVMMCFKPSGMNNLNIPIFTLNGKILKFVNEYKYLGVTITENLSDNEDIMRSTRYIYGAGNVLISKFKKCSDDVKVGLFKTYCSNLYGCHMWCRYYKYNFHRINVAHKQIFKKIAQP